MLQGEQHGDLVQHLSVDPQVRFPGEGPAQESRQHRHVTRGNRQRDDRQGQPTRRKCVLHLQGGSHHHLRTTQGQHPQVRPHHHLRTTQGQHPQVSIVSVQPKASILRQDNRPDSHPL